MIPDVAVYLTATLAVVALAVALNILIGGDP